jgi:DNA (cytosine-5)-methyltransferase 1
MSEGRKFKRANDTNLLLTTVNLIRHFRPDAIICENVEGIISGDKNSVLGKFKSSLKRAKFGFDAKVINAAFFGIPQNRRRTIGIGFDLEKYDSFVEVVDRDASLKKKVTVSDCIGNLPPLAAGEIHPKIPNHRARAMNELNLKRISCAKPGENNLYLKDTPYGDLSLGCHQRLEEKWGTQSFSDTYTRMRGDDVAPTITTKCVSITNGRFGHYDVNQNRGITPREAALLQTFPKDYVFYPEDNLSFAAVLIGNAVPPKLAAFFGRYITEKISS